jgi:hypothetical protein
MNPTVLTPAARKHDLAEDGVHPGESGRRKVAEMLLNFFKADPLAATWFVKRR